MRISDWSSDVCSSDLTAAADAVNLGQLDAAVGAIPVDSNNTGGFAAPSATGDNSLTVGNGAEASGEYSTATGVLSKASGEYSKIGRAHVLTPVTNAHLVCRLLLEKKTKVRHKTTQTLDLNDIARQTNGT